MFRAEIYRVFSRKAGLAAMLAGLFFILYYTMGNTVWGEGLVDEGRIYYGKEAIRRDKEIAAEFSGPLTEDVVRAIWEKYGPPVNYANRSTTKEGLEAAAAMGGNDNYCNRAMTSLFGEEIVGEDGEVTYALAEGWTESRYLQGGYTFGYTGSSRWFWDRFMMAYQLAYITIIVFLCPMFSEDYAFRTTDIILPAAKGRFRLWRLRLAVGCFLASAYYWLACGSIFLLYIAYYGTEGLSVSCGAGVRRLRGEQAVLFLAGAVSGALHRPLCVHATGSGFPAQGEGEFPAAYDLLQHAAVLLRQLCGSVPWRAVAHGGCGAGSGGFRSRCQRAQVLPSSGGAVKCVERADAPYSGPCPPAVPAR